jgi:hypothetical protein
MERDNENIGLWLHEFVDGVIEDTITEDWSDTELDALGEVLTELINGDDAPAAP